MQEQNTRDNRSITNYIKTQEIIKYDSKELTIHEMQNIVEEWYHSLSDDENENYLKLCNFLEKLDEGAFIWGILKILKCNGKEYYCFEGYHSNTDIKFHSSEVNRYCDYTFYYIPQSELKLILDLHIIMLDYFKYEKFVESLSDPIKKYIQKPREDIDENIRCLLSEYIRENIKLYSSIEFNSRPL